MLFLKDFWSEESFLKDSGQIFKVIALNRSYNTPGGDFYCELLLCEKRIWGGLDKNASLGLHMDKGLLGCSTYLIFVFLTLFLYNFCKNKPNQDTEHIYHPRGFLYASLDRPYTSPNDNCYFDFCSYRLVLSTLELHISRII